MSQTSGHVVIVGGGHAGGTVAALLRQYKYSGPITLVGAEAMPPYQRPPLSKAWLKGEADHASLALRPTAFYQTSDIELRLSTFVSAIELAERRVIPEAGEPLTYDHLILATGARARPLPVPGRDLDGVLELRSYEDADRLKAALGPGRRLAVVGGGYIGLEAAASARALGASATVIEREQRLLARVASPRLSEFFYDRHVAEGVEFMLGADVEALEGDAGRVRGVRLTDGRFVPCDVALIGVGALPNLELAREAGLRCEAGIVVDAAARTSDPAVWAIGDCTHRPLPLYDVMFRLESVPNALEQAKQVASALCGRPPPPPEVPWFWSDQYQIRLQIAGLPLHAAETVLRGDPESGSFAIFHLGEDERLLALEAVNAPPEFMAGRAMIGKRRQISADRLRDLSITMKELAA